MPASGNSSRANRLLAVIESFVGDLFSVASKTSVVEPSRTRHELSHTPKTLPSVEHLRAWFEEINLEYFSGKLPQVKIIYSVRMRCAGSYTPSQKTIRLGVKYHELFPEQLRDTLKHEMIHVLNPTHDRAFKAEAARIGASRYATHHPTLKRPPKYLYACPQCTLEYPRRKRLRMAHCGKCAKRDGLHSANKLVLRRKQDEVT